MCVKWQTSKGFVDLYIQKIMFGIYFSRYDSFNEGEKVDFDIIGR